MHMMKAMLTGVVIYLLAVVGAHAQAPELTQRWSIDGTPLGTERALERTIAATPERVFISGSVQRTDRRYQVIRVFDAATGRIVQTLENPSGEAFEGFGEAIAANEHFMVTGVPRRGETSGGLLVFDAQTGELLREIANPRAGEAAFFGQVPPVLMGDRILASVTLTDDNASTAWVFSAETGEILLTIDEPDVPSSLFSKAARSLFGRALAMSGAHIAITGTDRDGPEGLNAKGVVYVFDAATGAQLHRLTSPGSEKATGFGLPLLLSEDALFAGDLDETGPLNWPTSTLHALDPATGKLRYSVADPYIPVTNEDVLAGITGSDFGIAMVAAGGRLFVGLPGWTEDKFRQGGLMVLDAATGETQLTYLHKTGDENGSFGHTLGAMPDGLVIGLDFQSGTRTAQRVIAFDVR